MRLFCPPLVLAVLFFCSFLPAGEPVEVTDLGRQISVLNVNSGAFGYGIDGRLKAYALLYGDPLQLAVIDAATAELEQVLDVGNAKGAWDALATEDGTLYIASNPHGHLYRYLPDRNMIEDLGKVSETASFVWSIDIGKGRVYCGLYPNAEVAEYNPETNAFRNFGTVAPGEDYARTVAWDNEHEVLYVGIGSHADLIRLDPSSGNYKSVLPAEFKDSQFIYTLNYRAGQLLGLATPESKVFAMDTESTAVLGLLPPLAGHGFSPVSPDGFVYYVSHGRLISYDPETREYTKTEARISGSPRAFAFGRDEDGASILHIMLTYGRLVQYNPVSGEVTESRAELPHQPVAIQTMEIGPDNKLYTSGYFSGGAARYDLATGKHEPLSGIGQSEGIAFLNGRAYFGVYPHARIYSADITGEWKAKLACTLDKAGQDRPFAMIGVEEKQRLYIGTVPDYGVLGGALAVYDPTTDKYDIYKNIVPNQGIISLAYVGGKIIGGTTISGGLGIKPTEQEAMLFVWDTEQKKVIYETVPVSGKKAITSVTVGPEGNIYGWAEGVLFVFDPSEQKVIYADEKIPLDYSRAGHVWRDAHMALSSVGNFYGTINNEIFRLNPKTKDFTLLQPEGGFGRSGSLHEIAIGANGNIYAVKGETLFRIETGAEISP